MIWGASQQDILARLQLCEVLSAEVEAEEREEANDAVAARLRANIPSIPEPSMSMSAVTEEQRRDADFEAGLAAHRAARNRSYAATAGYDLAKASMTRILAEDAQTDTSTGAGAARASMARILRTARAE